jgi:hypothetical protein
MVINQCISNSTKNEVNTFILLFGTLLWFIPNYFNWEESIFNDLLFIYFKNYCKICDFQLFSYYKAISDY